MVRGVWHGRVGAVGRSLLREVAAERLANDLAAGGVSSRTRASMAARSSGSVRTDTNFGGARAERRTAASTGLEPLDVVVGGFYLVGDRVEIAIVERASAAGPIDLRVGHRMDHDIAHFGLEPDDLE